MVGVMFWFLVGYGLSRMGFDWGFYIGILMCIVCIIRDYLDLYFPHDEHFV